MLQNLSSQIKMCYERAADSHRRAQETGDPRLKADFEAMESGWLHLAQSYALSERLQRYLVEQDTKVSERDAWRPVAKAPFDRDLELAVINGAAPHAVAFPCRRILGGWMDAKTREKIDVRPTHWRDWT